MAFVQIPINKYSEFPKYLVTKFCALIFILTFVFFINKYVDISFNSTWYQTTVISNNSSSIDKVNQKELIFQPVSIDSNRKLFTPWSKDIQCKKYHTYFGKNLRKVFLRSFPRSGNSWTRYLLEGATGIFTGSIYSDGGLYRLGYLGENEDQNARTILVVKTHASSFGNKDLHFRIQNKDLNVPTILLLRHPAQSLTSYWAYTKSHKFFGTIESQLYNTTDFHNYVEKHLNAWKNLAADSLIYSDELLVIHYNDIKENPINEIERMTKFLGVPLDRDRLDCVSKYTTGPAKRKSEKIDPYTEIEKEKMYQMMTEINGLLMIRGMKPMTIEEI